jgi:hypothetical protein
MDQLLNEAVKSYLSRRGRKERSLEENLARLRTYRERDSGMQLLHSSSPTQASTTR